MKNSIFNLIKSLLLLIIITLISCNSEDNNEFVPTLPEATQIGANTFGCYVDGKLLTPRNGTGTIVGADNGMQYWGSTGSIYNEIDVHDFKSGTGGILTLHIQNLVQNGEGSFSIEESNCLRFNDANQTINIRCRYNNTWYCSIESSGTLNITRYDFDNRIVSGTFNCIAQNRDNPGEIIEITEGRFDIHRPTLESEVFP